jgi:hypothetical protein
MLAAPRRLRCLAPEYLVDRAAPPTAGCVRPGRTRLEAKPAEPLQLEDGGDTRSHITAHDPRRMFMVRRVMRDVLSLCAVLECALFGPQGFAPGRDF